MIPISNFSNFLQSVTLHTDVGDIKIELFCEDCPKTCENFLALCASDYYNGSLFHRNIKGFIVQTGDPTGTGKGGNSIWERKFEDEFKENLKHTDRGMVSMANSGPNTNASQFFFTYAAQPHLDLKYTIFGKTLFSIDFLMVFLCIIFPNAFFTLSCFDQLTLLKLTLNCSKMFVFFCSIYRTNH